MQWPESWEKTQRDREGNVKMEVEIGVMHLQAKGYDRLPAATGS